MFNLVNSSSRVKLFPVILTLIITLTAFGCGSDGSTEAAEDSGSSSSTNVPDAPSDLQANAATSTQVNLSWQDNSDNENGFKVERKISEGSYTEVGAVGIDSISFSDTLLTPDTTYFYRIRAYNDDGNSEYCTEVSTATSTSPPVAPTVLSAVAGSSSQIDLSWTDNSDNEQGFTIERSPDGLSFTVIDTANADSTSYSDIELASNTTYYYRILAYNTSGDSSYTSNATAATDDIIPEIPTALSLTVMSSGQIDLEWTDNSDNELGFEIARSLNGSTFTIVDTVSADETTYSDTTLDPDTTYYFRVRAYNLVGDSAYSGSASDTTNDVAPDAPTDLLLDVSYTTINLEWTDNSDNETGFSIERSLDGSSFSVIDTNSASDTTYSDTGLTPDLTYYYRVRAYNSAGDSSYSSIENDTTTETLPSSPTGLSAVAAGSNAIDLTWTDNSDNEQGFRIERSGDGSNFSELTTVAAGAESYQDTGLDAEITYYYRVYAYNSGGDSGFSGDSATTDESTSQRKLTVKIDYDGVRSVTAAKPIYVKVYSDSSCTNELFSQAFTTVIKGDQMTSFPDVGQSPVYVMTFHDVDGDGDPSTGEIKQYYYGAEGTPANPVNITEGGERILEFELESDELSSNAEMTLTVNYTPGGVSSSNKVFANIAHEAEDIIESDEPSSNTNGSISSNGSSMTFSRIERKYQTLFVYYDADGNEKLSDGDSYFLYDAKTIEEEPTLLEFSDSENKVLSVSFDDSNTIQSRSLQVTATYNGSMGTVSASKKIFVEVVSVPGYGIGYNNQDGDFEISSNGGSGTVNGIFTSKCRVLLFFDANGNGNDSQGEPYVIYNNKQVGDSYDYISITADGSESVSITFGDAYSFDFYDYDYDDGGIYYAIEGATEKYFMALFSSIPASTGTYTIGTELMGVAFHNEDIPYELVAHSGSVTITSLDSLSGSFSLSNFAVDGNSPPELTGTITGTFTNIAANPGDSDAGTLSATGTVDGYSIDVSGAGHLDRPYELVANIDNMPFADGDYYTSADLLKNFDFNYKFWLGNEENRDLTLSGNQGTVKLYTSSWGVDNSPPVSGEKYSVLLYVDSEEMIFNWDVAHNDYHSNRIDFVYDGSWSFGEHTFDQWTQLNNEGTIHNGIPRFSVSIQNCPVSDGEYWPRLNVCPALKPGYSSGYMPIVGDSFEPLKISGGSALSEFGSSVEVYAGETYHHILYIDTNTNWTLDEGEYVSEYIAQHSGANPETGIVFDTWVSYSSSGTQVSSVSIEGNITNLNSLTGNYNVRMKLFHEFYNASGIQAGSGADLTDGAGSYSLSAGSNLVSGRNYYIYQWVDDNSNWQVDAGEYVSTIQKSNFAGTSPVTGIDFDTFSAKTLGAIIGEDVVIDGSISNQELDDTTKNRIRIEYRSTNYFKYGNDPGMGGDVESITVDITGTPYTYTADSFRSMIVNKKYYYIMYLDANQNYNMDSGEQRCIVTTQAAYDGSHTVTGLNFSTWETIP